MGYRTIFEVFYTNGFRRSELINLRLGDIENPLEKVQVILSDEAQREFEELAGHKVFGGLARRYMKELNDFPPEAWGDIHQKMDESFFKSDNHIIFDIQGKIFLGEHGTMQSVKIFRFRLRHKA